ncbi:MAG: hypothetical protein ACI33K_11520 [Clostridiaceae bacterium]
MEVLIIVLGLILIISNYKKVFNEEISTTFSNELNMKKEDELSLRLIELRSEIGESFLIEQQEIEELKTKIDKLYEDISYLKGEIKDIHLDKTISKRLKNKKDSVDNIKVEKIRELLADDMSIEDICHITGAGKGEVLLIKELFPH